MGVLLALFHYFFPPAHPHWKLAAGSVVLFAAICAGLFFAGLSAVKGNNKYAFNNLISASVFGKMVVSVGFLFFISKSGNACKRVVCSHFFDSLCGLYRI